MASSVVVMGCASTRNCEGNNLLIQRPMVCIDQLDQNLVRPRRKAIDNDRYTACICPVPGGVIDSHMDVPNPWNHRKCGRSKYRQDLQVLRVIGKEQNATRKRLCLGGVDNELCRRLALRDPNSWRHRQCALNLRMG